MTQVTSSTPADSEPCMCGRTTLVTLVSMTCITVTSMAESVMSHFCAPENSPTAAAVMPWPVRGDVPTVCRARQGAFPADHTDSPPAVESRKGPREHGLRLRQRAEDMGPRGKPPAPPGTACSQLVGSAAGVLGRGALAKLDGDDRGHARAQRVGIAELAGVEADLHGEALDHLHPVARGVLGGQQREARARARGERVHRAAKDAVGEGVHADLGAHAGPDAGELRLLEV